VHALLQPFAEAFMRRALLELLLLGVAGSLVGCWVLLYELAYSSESLAHALLPGLVVAALLGIPLLAGGSVGVLAAAIAIAFVGRIPLIERDTGVAVVISSLFGLGVVLALSPSSPPGLESLLFGDLLGVTRGDLVISSVLVAATGAAVVALHRPLLVAGFDRRSARAFGASPFLVDAALLVLIAVGVLIGVQALGNLLVIALLVGPAAAARQLVDRLPAMMGLAMLFAWTSALAGLYVSYYLDIAAGAAVASATVALFLVAALAGAVRDT
jgi:ABC-type Mn2+/Zn2+ transport system permease subunit